MRYLGKCKYGTQFILIRNPNAKSKTKMVFYTTIVNQPTRTL